MSTLQNDILAEKLEEEFEIAFSEDYDLRGALANRLLDGTEYYLFCKEDAHDYLDDLFDGILEDIHETFINSDGSTFDIRELCCKTYNIDI